MGFHPEMDEWRYKIVGDQYQQFDEATEVRTPYFHFESEIFWDADVAKEALEDMKILLPKANMSIQKTRDRWEEIR